MSREQITAYLSSDDVSSLLSSGLLLPPLLAAAALSGACRCLQLILSSLDPREPGEVFAVLSLLYRCYTPKREPAALLLLEFCRRGGHRPKRLLLTALLRSAESDDLTPYASLLAAGLEPSSDAPLLFFCWNRSRLLRYLPASTLTVTVTGAVPYLLRAFREGAPCIDGETLRSGEEKMSGAPLSPIRLFSVLLRAAFRGERKWNELLAEFRESGCLLGGHGLHEDMSRALVDLAEGISSPVPQRRLLELAPVVNLDRRVMLRRGASYGVYPLLLHIIRGEETLSGLEADSASQV